MTKPMVMLKEEKNEAINALEPSFSKYPWVILQKYPKRLIACLRISNAHLSQIFLYLIGSLGAYTFY